MELLERTPFLDTLTGYAQDARQGSGRLVLVSGESGMGKTVLAEAFQQQLADARWLWGSCDGLLTPRPLGPLFDIGPQAGGELAVLCRQGAARDQLFTAFLAELGAPGPLTVVVIEDLHWADEATTDLLSYLGRRLARVPALILATYRDEEIAADHPLRMVLGDLATQRSTRRMRMPPLSVSAVAALAGPHGADAAELHRITGGNPFYVSEILDAGWPSIPPTVRDAVGARLARATPGTRRLVESAAVIGGRVDRELLAAALNEPGSGSGRGPGDTAGLDEGLSTGILMADGPGLRFRHELVRMAVEASIPPHRTAELHKRLLTALEDRGGADPALLAHHAEGAADAPAVRRHAPEAARRSAALGAHREAAAQFERALRFAAGADDATLAALHEGLGGECALLDRWEEAEATLRSALRLHHDLGDELSAGRNLWMLSKALWRLCRGEEAAETAEEGVRILAGQPASPELAWAYAQLSALRLHVGETDQAIALGEQACRLGEQLGLPEVVSYALNTIGCAQGRDGHSGMDMMDPVRRELVGTADIVHVVGIAPVDEDVAGLDAGQEVRDGRVHKCRRNHQPNCPRPVELLHEVLQRGSSDRLRAHQFFHRLGRAVEDDALVASLEKSPHHVRPSGRGRSFRFASLTPSLKTGPTRERGGEATRNPLLPSLAVRASEFPDEFPRHEHLQRPRPKCENDGRFRPRLARAWTCWPANRLGGPRKSCARRRSR